MKRQAIKSLAAAFLFGALTMGCAATSFASIISDRVVINGGGIYANSDVTFLEGDLLKPLRASGLSGRVDIVVSNPPYIAEREWEALQPEVRLFEPRIALAGGEDGLAVYRRLVQEAAEFLSADGWLIMEVGQGQAESVRMLLDATKQYGVVDVRPDLAGIDRVVCAQRTR